MYPVSISHKGSLQVIFNTALGVPDLFSCLPGQNPGVGGLLSKLVLGLWRNQEKKVSIKVKKVQMVQTLTVSFSVGPVSESVCKSTHVSR
jgi:hypothetical protein